MADEPPFIRPGPPSIEPGRCPGGVVIHVYAVPSGALVTEHRVRLTDDVALAAEADAAAFDAFTADAACLVAYDGDTGERAGPLEWGTSNG